VSVGSGDRRRRASSARGPSPTSFGRLGLTRARQPCSSGFSSMAGALGCLREGFTSRQRGRTSRATFGAVLHVRACLVCRGVHAIPVSMPSLCPCHSVCHVAIRSCVRASRLCACHEHTRMERVHARMERVHARAESCSDVGECGATTGG
jgi:hypothetical protein